MALEGFMTAHATAHTLVFLVDPIRIGLITLDVPHRPP